MNEDKIVYSISIEDVQNVAEQELGRSLTNTELNIVEDKIGGYFDWFEAVATVISTHVEKCTPE